MSTDFSALIAVGGNELELDRLQDTLESLAYHEPGVNRVVVIDDFDGRYSVRNRLPKALIEKVVILPNPRNGIVCGWGAGLSAGILHGLNWLANNTSKGFIFKFDTDSLIISPFAKSVADRFATYPGIGLLGTYEKSPNRILDKPEDVPAAPALRKLSRRFTIWRRTYNRWPHLQCSLFPKARSVRNVILAAEAKGYKFGRHCQGGGYALSRSALESIRCGGYLDRPTNWLWTPCGEDIVVTLVAAAAGYPAADFNDDGQPFGVKPQGLIDTPAKLADRGFAVIHSVKDYGPFREADTREFFRRRRESSTVAT